MFSFRLVGDRVVPVLIVLGNVFLSALAGEFTGLLFSMGQLKSLYQSQTYVFLCFVQVLMIPKP